MTMKTKVSTKSKKIVTITLSKKQAQILNEICDSISGCEFMTELGWQLYNAVGYAEHEYFSGNLEAI